MIIPPRPGKVSCTIDAAVRSLSIPADSSRPLTIIASDSSSESNTFTNFSLGSGRRCVFADESIGSTMVPPVGIQDRAKGDVKILLPSKPIIRYLPQNARLRFSALVTNGTNLNGHLWGVVFSRNSGRMAVITAQRRGGARHPK